MAVPADTIQSIVVDANGTIYVEARGVIASQPQRWFPSTHSVNEFEIRITSTGGQPTNATVSNPLVNWTTISTTTRVTMQYTTIDSANEWSKPFLIAIRRKSNNNDAVSDTIVLNNNIIEADGGIIDGFNISMRGSVTQDGDGDASLTFYPDGTWIGYESNRGSGPVNGQWYEGNIGTKTFEFIQSNISISELNGSAFEQTTGGALLSIGAEGRFGVGPGPGHAIYSADLEIREIGNPSNKGVGRILVEVM